MWKADTTNYHQGAYISASMLAGQGCPRQTVFERYEDFWDQPRRRFWAFRGSAIHSMCEGSAPVISKYGWMQEVALTVDFEYDHPAPIFEAKATESGDIVQAFTGQYDPKEALRITVRGTFDAYNPFTRTLADMKSMSSRKVLDTIKGNKGGTYSPNLDDAHVEQFNFYRLLIARTKITDDVREQFRAHGLPELKGRNFPAPTQLVMQAIEMMELPRSGSTYALSERGSTTLYDIDPVPVLPLHEIEQIMRPRALQWYKWLVLREPTPVVPKEKAWLCRNCQFNAEILPHGICYPSKERAENRRAESQADGLPDE